MFTSLGVNRIYVDPAKGPLAVLVNISITTLIC